MDLSIDLVGIYRTWWWLSLDGSCSLGKLAGASVVDGGDTELVLLAFLQPLHRVLGVWDVGEAAPAHKHTSNTISSQLQ